MSNSIRPTISLASLASLEPLIDRLIQGTADTKAVAKILESLGYPTITDPTEQLRLALRLLECHDDIPKKGSQTSAKPSTSKRTPREAESSI